MSFVYKAKFSTGTKDLLVMFVVVVFSGRPLLTLSILPWVKKINRRQFEIVSLFSSKYRLKYLIRIQFARNIKAYFLGKKMYEITIICRLLKLLKKSRNNVNCEYLD